MVSDQINKSLVTNDILPEKTSQVVAEGTSIEWVIIKVSNYKMKNITN